MMWLLFSCLVAVSAQFIYRPTVDGIEFKEISNYTAASAKERSYRDIEFDQYVTGNFLFRSQTAFWTASRTTLVAEPIAGNDNVYQGNQDGTGIYAWFTLPRHIQWNKTTLLVVDGRVPRVRIVSRLTNTSSTVIGGCESCQRTDRGNFSTSTLPALYAIAKVATQPSIAWALGDNTMWKLDFDTQTFEDLDVSIRSITAEETALLISHPSDPVLYFYSGYDAIYNGVLGSVNVVSHELKIIIPHKGQAEGFLDGILPLSLVGGSATSLVLLNNNVLMLSVTYTRKRLLIIDLTTNMTSSVCRPDSSSSSPDCDVLSSTPQSLLVDKEKDRVIIGHQGYLSYLQLDGLNNITETTTTMTTTKSATTTMNDPTTSGPGQHVLLIGVSIGGVGFIMLVTGIVLLVIAHKLKLHSMTRRKEEPTAAFSTERPAPDRDYEEVPDQGDHQYEACSSGRDMMTHGYVNLTLTDHRSQTGEESDPSYLNMSPQ